MGSVFYWVHSFLSGPVLIDVIFFSLQERTGDKKKTKTKKSSGAGAGSGRNSEALNALATATEQTLKVLVLKKIPVISSISQHAFS